MACVRRCQNERTEAKQPVVVQRFIQNNSFREYCIQGLFNPFVGVCDYHHPSSMVDSVTSIPPYRVGQRHSSPA